MKTKLLSLIVLSILTLYACQEKEAEEKTEAPDHAMFNKKIETLRAFFQAHSDENLAAQSDLVSDTLSWSPAAFNNNKNLGKTELMAALKGYHDNFEDIKFTEGIMLNDSLVNGVWSGSVFPQEQASSTPDAIRIYGTWSAKHTESGKEIGVKYFALGWVNADGKITQWSEYFDVNGIAVQIAEE